MFNSHGEPAGTFSHRARETCFSYVDISSINQWECRQRRCDLGHIIGEWSHLVCGRPIILRAPSSLRESGLGSQSKIIGLGSRK